MKNARVLNKVLLAATISLCVVFIPPVTLIAGWKSDRENLDHVYIIDNFRIFYTLEGKNAITDQTDNNKNNIPDIVEDIAIQLGTANKLYSEVFGFVQPAVSRRYKDQINSIDVHIMSSEYKGVSGDGIITYKYRKVKIPATGALTITISNKIKAGNLTPAHELTHSYQNSYTMFKNRWFTEGVARWMEYAFKEGTGKQKKLPDTAYDFEKLLLRTYDAKYFWRQ